MKTPVTTIIICILTLTAWYLSPYLAIYRVLDAAQSHDAEQLSTYLDQDSIKANFARVIKGKVDQRIIESVRRLPMGELPLIAAEHILDATLDALVSPAMIGNLLMGQRPSVFFRAAPAIKADIVKPEVDWEYDSDHDHFTMSIRSRQNSNQKTRFAFYRQGLIGGWQIIAIECSDIRDIIALIG